MGVEHYLVDDEGKNVLGCHKWYDLDYADRDNITEAEILAANERFPHLPALAVQWVREVCKGRRVRLVTDSQGGEPWLDDETFQTRPEWTCWSAFGATTGWRNWPDDGKGVVPYQAPELPPFAVEELAPAWPAEFE